MKNYRSFTSFLDPLGIIMKMLLLFYVFLSSLAIAQAQQNQGEFPIGDIKFRYGATHPELHSLAELDELIVTLSRTGNTFSFDGDNLEEIGIGSIPSSSVFTTTGLHSLLRQVVGHYNELGYAGVYVVPDSADIDARTGRDKRGVSTDLTLVVWVGQVDSVRTIAKGGYKLDRDPINSPSHTKISQNSPILDTGDLLDTNSLHEYVIRLNRHPGRRVDVAVSSSGEPGKLILDYLVNENKPWFVYTQVSNTGTDTTGEIRGKIGYVNNQFSGSDDIFSMVYGTAFDSTEGVEDSSGETNSSGFDSLAVSYSRPFAYPDTLSGRIYASSAEFDATDLGIRRADLFGSNTTFGFDLIHRPKQFLNHDLEFVVGGRIEEVEIIDGALQKLKSESPDLFSEIIAEGQGDITHLFAGVSISKVKPAWSFRSDIMLNSVSVSSNDPQSQQDAGLISVLGRANASDSSSYITAGIQGNLFLDSLVHRKKWKDPVSWKSSRLAHELTLNVRGQFAPTTDRLLAQKEFLAGGLFTVRGYPESIAAGDSGYVGSIAYKVHLPRLLKPYSEFDDESRPKKFRGKWNTRPPTAVSNPDWDIAVGPFMDAGKVWVNGRAVAGEENYDLLSAGFGVEMKFFQYFNLRVDYGVVMESFELVPSNAPGSSNLPRDGDSRIHVLSSVSW